MSIRQDLVPSLEVEPTLDVGNTRVIATVEDPVVRVSLPDNERPALHFEEGAVFLELSFPYVDCIERFQKRVAALRVPRGDAITPWPPATRTPKTAVPRKRGQARRKSEP
jgi:hypothetical protein